MTVLWFRVVIGFLQIDLLTPWPTNPFPAGHGTDRFEHARRPDVAAAIGPRIAFRAPTLPFVVAAVLLFSGMMLAIYIYHVRVSIIHSWHTHDDDDHY